MNCWTETRRLYIVVLAASLVTGCMKDYHPVEPVQTHYPPPSPPPPLDDRIAGYWYPQEGWTGYAFYSGGVWEEYDAFQNRLTQRENGRVGQYATPKPGVCDLFWINNVGLTRTESSARFTYSLSNNDSTLRLTWTDGRTDSVRVYWRKGSGDVTWW